MARLKTRRVCVANISYCMRFFWQTLCKSTGIRQFQNLKIFSTIEFIGIETMVKYSKEFKEQAQLRPDESGSEKGSRAAGDQLLYDCWLAEGQKPKSEGREDRIGQNAVEPARACYAVRNTGAAKTRYVRQKEHILKTAVTEQTGYNTLAHFLCLSRRVEA